MEFVDFFWFLWIISSNFCVLNFGDDGVGLEAPNLVVGVGFSSGSA